MRFEYVAFQRPEKVDCRCGNSGSDCRCHRNGSCSGKVPAREADCLNYEKRTLSSTKQMSPTTDTTSLDSRNTSGVQNDASMSHDNVQAQSGAVTSADTSAEATEAGTQASEVRTQAINTKLGTLTTNSTITQLN